MVFLISLHHVLRFAALALLSNFLELLALLSFHTLLSMKIIPLPGLAVPAQKMTAFAFAEF